MKAALFAVLSAGAAGIESGADPIGQVIDLCNDLSAKVTQVPAFFCR